MNDKETKVEKVEGEVLPSPGAEIITITTVEDLISIARKRLDTVPQLVEMALKATTYRDWVDQSGEPQLVHSGAEKVARLFGIKTYGVNNEKVMSSDTKGEFYMYITRGTVALPGNIDSIEAVGTCSQRDTFFAKARGQWLESIDIDETNIIKASQTNFMVNGVTHLLGLRNLTWEQVKAAGIEKGQIQKIERKKGFKKTKQALTKKDEDIKDKIWKMAVEMAMGDEGQAKTFVRAESKYFAKDKDGKETKEEKYFEDPKDCTSSKWLFVTYQKMKKAFQQAYPDKPLPFKDEDEEEKKI